MRCLTIILDANDTPKSIAVLAALGTAIEGIADPDALHSKAHNIKWFRIYPEQTNNVDAANGAARIGFEQLRTQASFKTSRVAATQHGIPMLPGIVQDFIPDGQGGPYDFSTTAISGAIGDQFQIVYDPA